MNYDHLAWLNLCFDIIHNSFHVGLPPYMARLIKKSNHSNDEESEEDQPVKKSKKPKKEPHSLVRNTNQLSEWNCKKKYKKIFTPDILAMIPKFNLQDLSCATNGIARGVAMTTVTQNRCTHHSLMTSKRKHMAYGSRSAKRG